MSTYTKHEPTVRTIWGLAKSPELCLTDEELHLVVQAQTGKASIRSLTKREIGRVTYVLQQMKDSAKGGKRGRKYSSGSSTTENQRKKVYKLMEAYGWSTKRVNGLCRHMFRVDSVSFLDYRQISKLIEAMKAIGEREKGEQDAGLQAGTDG